MRVTKPVNLYKIDRLHDQWAVCGSWQLSWPPPPPPPLGLVPVCKFPFADLQAAARTRGSKSANKDKWWPTRQEPVARDDANQSNEHPVPLATPMARSLNLPLLLLLLLFPAPFYCLTLPCHFDSTTQSLTKPFLSLAPNCQTKTTRKLETAWRPPPPRIRIDDS